MMNQEDRELVQAVVDGELDDAGRERLDQLLASSEEARQLQADLRRLNAFIDQVPRYDLPDGLHGQITGNIALKPPARKLFQFSALPVFFRYGLAASAAVVLTVAVFRSGSELEGTSNYSDMVGTIARGGPVADGRELDAFGFDEAGASGKVRLLERDGVYALEFDVRSPGSLQFDVDLQGAGLVLDAFAQQDQPLEAMSWSGEKLTARASGDQKFVILMRRTDESAAAGSKIGLEISRQGASVSRGWLEPDW
jgi:hypothetical protein